MPVARYQAIHAKAGQMLAFGMAASGCRGYLSIRGGFDVPVVMGSRSTDMSAKLGGFEGRALKTGDVLPTIPADDWTPATLAYEPPVYESAVTVRVVPGPQEEYFTAAGLDTFFSASYEIKAIAL